MKFEVGDRILYKTSYKIYRGCVVACSVDRATYDILWDLCYDSDQWTKEFSETHFEHDKRAMRNKTIKSILK